MLSVTDKYSGRLFIGFIFAFVFHAVVFVVLQIVFQINFIEKSEYPQTIFVSLENTDYRSVQASTNVSELTDDSVNDKNESDGSNTQVAKTNPVIQETKKFVTIPEQKKIEKKTDTSTQKNTTDTGSKIADTGKTTNDTIPIKGESVPQPTAGKSGLDQGGLAGLDQALGDNSGTDTSGSSSKGDTGKTTDNKSSSQKGGSVGGNIQWEDNNTRKMLSNPKPIIPSSVGKEGKPLEAILSFELTAEGLLMNIRVVRSTGYTEVDTAFRDALMQYRFERREGAKNITGEITFVIGYK